MMCLTKGLSATTSAIAAISAPMVRIPCPVCKAVMAIRHGQGRPFYVCNCHGPSLMVQLANYSIRRGRRPD